MTDDQLEELETLETAQAEQVDEASAPAMMGPPPPPPPARKAFPQLFRFFWGGVIVFVGALLPFGPAVLESMYGGEVEETIVGNAMSEEDKRRLAENLGTDNPTIEAPAAVAETGWAARPAFHTFTGALFLLFGLILAGQMFGAIQDRRVALGGVLLMFFPAGWTWFKVVMITKELEWFSAGKLYLLGTYDKLALDLGSGFMIILFGSTYVVFNFLRALGGAMTGGGKKAAPPPSRSRRSSK